LSRKVLGKWRREGPVRRKGGWSKIGARMGAGTKTAGVKEIGSSKHDGGKRGQVELKNGRSNEKKGLK
jgi:hypothetical protein